MEWLLGLLALIGVAVIVPIIILTRQHFGIAAQDAFAGDSTGTGTAYDADTFVALADLDVDAELAEGEGVSIDPQIGIDLFVPMDSAVGDGDVLPATLGLSSAIQPSAPAGVGPAFSPQVVTVPGGVNSTVTPNTLVGTGLAIGAAIQTSRSVVAPRPVGTGVAGNVTKAASRPADPVLSGTNGNNVANLTWTTPANNGATIDGYRIIRDLFLANPASFDVLNVNSYSDTTALNGIEYSYRITAHNSVGYGNGSNEVFVTPSGGSGAPNLPADTLVGTPANRLVGWIEEPDLIPGTDAYYTTWGTTNGWRALATQSRWLYGFGGSNDFKGSNAGTSTTPWTHQHALEPSGGNRAALMANHGIELFITTRPSQSGDDNDLPPFGGNWNNNTVWNSVAARFGGIAAFLNFVSGAGILLDYEYVQYGWHDTAQAGLTAAQTRAIVRQRGYQVGNAIWGADPSLHLLGYHLFYTGGTWDYLVTNQPFETYTHNDWTIGLCEAMADNNANGTFVHTNANFYRRTTGFQTWYLRDHYGIRSALSAYMKASPAYDNAAWTKVMRYYRTVGFMWAGDDAATQNTAPSAATWASMQAAAREYSDGPYRQEFVFNFGLGYPGSASPNCTKYAQAAAVSGTQTGASSAAIASTIPAITNLAASRVGSTVTITCRVAHKYGVRRVTVHNPATFVAGNSATYETSILGTMWMTFNENGGTMTTNYNNVYQACDLALTGSAGSWFVIRAISVKDDVAWARIQSP